MAKYTTQFGSIYDSGFQPLFDALAAYPIFDGSHRSELNGKIYNRFRFREIGFETAAMFCHYLKTTLFEIMPLYNELYRSAALEYDILSDADYTETTNAGSASDSATSGSSSGTTHGAHGRSDTPQGAINFTDLSANQYLTDADIDDGTTSGTSVGESHTVGSSNATRTVQGKMPGRSYPEMIKQYRETVLNIDRMILDDLESCFMGVY